MDPFPGEGKGARGHPLMEFNGFRIDKNGRRLWRLPFFTRDASPVTEFNAKGGSRTRTPLRALAPKASASANSATFASANILSRKRTPHNPSHGHEQGRAPSPGKLERLVHGPHLARPSSRKWLREGESFVGIDVGQDRLEICVRPTGEPPTPHRGRLCQGEG